MADAAKFSELTGATPDRAAFFLAAAGGDLEVAVTQFFESGAEAAAPMADVSTATPATATPAAAAAAAAPSGPRIATLSSMQTGPDGDDDNDGSNELYAGGKTSGIAVQGPPKKLDGEGVKAVFDAAKEHGAVAAHEHKAQQAAAPAAPRFTGAGYRLGEEGEPSAVVTPSAAAAAPAEPKDMEVTVTFYRNGFTVDDGVNPVSLRNLDEPQNAAFLNSITRNEMPEELVRFGKPIDLHMVDKRDAEYVPPKPTVKSFSGTGHRLGAPTTTGATADATAAAPPPVSSGPAPTVNEDEPVTKLQLKLADGTRMVARFNLTQPVSDIRRVMDSSRPASAPYVLMTTFPNRVLTDETETIETAKLAGAVVIQRPA